MIPMMMPGAANNPVMQLVNAARQGGNPMSLVQQMAGSNPQAQVAWQMIANKNPAQLKIIAQNLARERGIDLGALANQMGLQLPK